MGEKKSELSPDEVQRYARHLTLPEVGAAGQTRLKNGSVLVIGAGGLGSPALLYLAAAGVGTIGIVDDDRVDVSNLQRQILYNETDLGKSKALIAKERLEQLNQHIKVVAYEHRFTAENALELVRSYDVILDGTDNFGTRFMVNDACVLARKPNVHGAIYRFEGQASVFGFEGGPCYRCLFPEPPAPDAVPNCAEGGVLGVMAGTIGVFQATEAVKILLGLGASLSGKLLIYDALTFQITTLPIQRKQDCPVCGERPTITTVAEAKLVCAAPLAHVQQISPGELKERLLIEQNGGVSGSDTQFVLLDVRNDDEFTLGHIDGALHIPLPQLSQRLQELCKDATIAVYCKSGGRSTRAANLLIEQGFGNVVSLSGGIKAWVRDVDEKLPVQ